MFDDPRSSPAAFFYAVFLIVAILISLVSLFMSSLPQYWIDGANFLYAKCARMGASLTHIGSSLRQSVP